MAMNDYDAVDRAARLLRVVPEPGWQAIEDGVIAAVRATPRGGWPLLVDDPRPGTAAGVLRVSELVLGALLSRALAHDPDARVTDIRIESQAAVLQSISVELSGRYRADLAVAVDRARAVCEEVVTEVIGDAAGVSIHAAVTDIHR
jgi:hypothetical protein